MLEAAMLLLLRKLTDVAVNKALDLYHINNEIELLQLELRMIQGFLRDADSKRKRNNLVMQWVKEVSAMVCRIDDIVDTYLVEIEENCSKESGIVGQLKRLVKHPSKLYKLCGELKATREVLKIIYERGTHLGITNNGTSVEEHIQLPFKPAKLGDIDVSNVVGFDSEKNQIIQHLLDRTISRRMVLSIVGIGGLGKTTLAKKIYRSTELEREFDCFTWLSISQRFDLGNVLRTILYSIVPQMQNQKVAVTDENLPTELKTFMSGKKYLIILDDVWTVDLWDRLKILLPDSNNGSRVLITSRSLDVAIAADPETTPYRLPYLTEEESVQLLLKKTFPNKIRENYPPDLIKAAKQLTKKCGGLPLALIVVGGILSRREPTYTAWNIVDQTMDWHSEEGNKCSQIIAMSYEDLPYHLKPCFLYFSSFPEDYEISAKHVTRMWIAEGFIPKDGVGTLEDRADAYFEELVQRCLVQVIKKSWNGYCKLCRMHDLLRDLAIHEAKENKFFTIFSKTEHGSQLNASMARRMALQFCTSEYGVHSRHTRSLLSFGKHISNYCGFRLLRVLTIERVNVHKENACYKWLEKLIYLRYLGFRYCDYTPHGLGHVCFSSLSNLETLDFKETGNNINEKNNHYGVPNDSLWKIASLRNLVFPSGLYISGPSKWDQLKNLQTLKWVRLEKFPVLECNINLNKLGLRLEENTNFWKKCGSAEEVWKILKDLLKRMKLLASLAISVHNIYRNGHLPFGTSGTSDFPCHEKLQYLYLRGRWPTQCHVLSVKMFPTNLTKLVLIDSKLVHDPMPILERLQSLRILRLWGDSYVGTEIICSAGGFPSLQKLEFEDLPNLCRMGIKDGAMSILGHLKIVDCNKLHVLPELQKMRALLNLTLSKGIYKRMLAEDHYKIKHIPSITVRDW